MVTNVSRARAWVGVLRGRNWKRESLQWLVIIAVTYFGGTEAERYGLPAPHLFAALVIGLVVALSRFAKVTVPPPLYLAAQALTGVVIGTYFTTSSLGSAGSALVPLLLVTAATLVISVGGGVVLARWSGLDRPTAALGMIAGGSAAIVATSDDLKADPRLVAFMQYLRLVLVVLSAPLLVRWVLAPSGTYEALGPKEIEAASNSLAAYGLMAATAVIGAWLARRLRIPAGALLGPLLLAALLNIAGVFHGRTPPELPREIAFSLIGLEVGLRFTIETVRRVGRLFPKILALVIATVVACGLLAWAVTAVTNISLLNAYLATTPGGINAILVTAFASNANTTLIFAVQTIRLFAMVLLAPAAVGWLLRRSPAGTFRAHRATRARRQHR